MIVGVMGFIGSGKDTVADYLVNFHGYRRESYASALKDAVAAVFGWDRVLLEGRTTEARTWREQIDSWWARRLNMPTLTPRWVLQYWGTDVCRNAFHDDIWIASLERKLTSIKDNVVISDCRFPNEIRSLQNAGGVLAWVQRGQLPAWYDLAITANQGDSISRAKLLSIGIHASEWAWVGSAVDINIDNNGTIDYLYNQVNTSITQLTLPPNFQTTATLR